MSLDNIVNVQITKGTKVVTEAGFGTALILGQHTRFAGRIKYYNDADEMLDDGFLTSDAEYKAAVKYFSQEKTPERVAIGRRLAKVAQVNTVSVGVIANAFSYTVTINGVVFTYLSDADATGAEIQAGLIAAVNGGAEPVTASAGVGTSVVLTADVAGNSFTVAVGTNLTVAATTANVGVIEDIAAVVDENDDWYALALTSRDNDDIKNAASSIEARTKIFMACVEDSDVITSATDDIASELKALAYVRTALIWSTDQENYPDAAWLGRVLPDVPGSETWKFKTLAGIAADNLTGAQESNATGKNANVYKAVGGINITFEGKMASGEFIDVTRLIDWAVARIQETVYSRLVNVEKIPFTDAGVAVILEAISSVIKQGQINGGIATDPSPTITAPKVADVPSASRAARTLPDVEFDFTLAGAVHRVEVQGVVSV